MNIKSLIPLPIAVAAAVFFAPVSGHAQVLLTASEYALLGGTAITVGGPGPNPIVNGNVGLSSSATSNITGFPPAVVSGFTVSGAPAGIIATGGATLQAGNDLITARNALFAMAHVPANDLSNLDFGTLAALRPGVYFSTSAVTQTGAIVLDANFQNGVAWVFDMSLSLTTAANSTVTFVNLGTNGGNDNGVYWNAATAISIGDNNTVLGNYLAGTSISFTGITNTVAGGGIRALAGAAVTFAGKVPAGFNVTGGPGGGDYDGGLQYVGGVLVPIPPVVIPPVVIPPVVVPPVVVFTGNVLLSATGSFAPGPSGVTLVPGTNYPTTTLTIDGNSTNGSAPASFTVNTATVTLTGTGNTYTGGTVVNNGALIASTANLPVNGTVALNTSTLNFNQTADGTFGGVISGNGAVVKIGTGALTVTAPSTYTGGTVVTGGSLIASTTTLPVNQAVSVGSGGILVFNQTADGSFGGSITGGGKVQKKGAGALTVVNTTNSPVDVQAGAFYFSTGVGATTVSAGALLGGNGTIAGNLTNSGTVSPGFSPGTINVVGNYSQTATGLLIVQIASGASFDKLAVTGTAALAGTLQVELLAGFNPLGQTFTFLTAAGGVSGTFGTVTGGVANSAATAAAVIYAPTSVSISFTQLPFAGFAGTPNQVAVANAGQGSAPVTVTLDGLQTAGQFPVAFNAISPQGYEIWSEAAFGHATSLSDRLLRADGATRGHDNYYFDATQRRSRARADADIGSTTFTTTSALIGGDHVMSSNLTVGAYFNYGETVSSLGSPGSRTSIKSKMLGLRAVKNYGDWFAQGAVAYGYDRYSSSRPVVFAGTSALASSSNNGRQWFADINVGRKLTAGAVTVSPFTGLLITGWRANGFTETGAGVYNLKVSSQSARSVRSQAGLEAALAWNFGSMVLRPHVRAAWLHEFDNDARRIYAVLDSVPFSVRTRRPSRNSALGSAGLDLMFNPNAMLYTDFTAQSGGIVRYLSEWRVGFAMSF